MSDRSSTSERHLVIGAGPVGLAMGAALKHRGIPFDIVDAGSLDKVRSYKKQMKAEAKAAKK